jgi:uncharacterized protein with predicted RNA binding PUA domain
MLLCLYLSKQQNKSVDVAMENQKGKVRSIADYQFGKGVGAKLFPVNIEIQLSPRTGRIRYINLDGERLATLRPTDGVLSLSIKAAKIIAEEIPEANCFVTVKNDVAPYIAKGGDVFAVHVVKVDDEIGAKDEVIAVDEDHRVLAVGRTLLSAPEIRAFKTGAAVKVRHGTKES